jgi:hypothetical protein
VVATIAFNGPISSIASGGSGAPWTFAGPGGNVTVASGQRITASAGGAMALASGSANQLVEVSLCYQLVGGGSMIAMYGAGFMVEHFTTTRTIHSASMAAMPPAGTYTVGLCVRNTGPAAINNNDYVAGWVQVTN